MTAVVLVAAGTAGCRRDRGRIEVGRPLESPAVYSSKNGVLHLQVRAEQADTTISHRDYGGMFVYRTRVVGGRGSFRSGTASAYVAPEWHVMPGDRLVVDYVNDLPEQKFTPLGGAEGLYPQPINLHTHGLTVRPSGNGDNVLLSIPRGRSNRYTIDIPPDQHAGLYWYHPHIHGLSDDQVYEGLAGHIVVGRADGHYAEFDGLKVRPMMLRYSVVQPVDGDLVDASPTDVTGTSTNTMVYTVNGLVSPRIPLRAANPSRNVAAESQVWAFTNITGSASYILALDEVDKADALKIDVVGRPLDITVVSIDGTSMPSPIVLTGDAAKRGYLLGQGGRVALLVQGASGPSKVVRLMQVQNRSGSGEASASDWANHKLIGGYRQYTRAVLAVGEGAPRRGTRHVDTPSALTPDLPSSDHGLAAEPVAQKRTIIFNDVSRPTEQTPNEFGIDFGLFPDVPIAQPRVGTVEEWTILNYSSLHHPFHVHTQYNQVMSVDAPINPDFHDDGDYRSLQYVTDMNQPQPADYLQDVVNLPPALVDSKTGMPVLGADGVPVAPGKIVLRVKIDDYLGTYVEHCHRLPHEDRGMMAMVRSIPNEPIVAVADGSSVEVVRGSDGRPLASIAAGGQVPVAAVGDYDADAVPDVAVVSSPTTVSLYSGASRWHDLVATITPFGDATQIGSLTLGDLNGDSRDDVVVGQGDGGSRVVVIDAAGGKRLADFAPYGAGVDGVSVATGVLEAGGRVSLVTGAGRGGPPQVKVYNFDLFGDARGGMPDLHKAGALKPLRVASTVVGQSAYRGGVAVATGYPFAGQGGFASIVVTPFAGPVTATTLTLASHHGGHVVSASGVFLAEDYQPGARRMLRVGPALDATSSLRDGARPAFVSTPAGGDLVLVPAGGGKVARWVADGRRFVQGSGFAISGSTVAAM